MAKITGSSDRPRDGRIARTGAGIPDDGTAPIEASEEAIAETRRKLQEGADIAESTQLERQLERPKHGTA